MASSLFYTLAVVLLMCRLALSLDQYPLLVESPPSESNVASVMLPIKGSPLHFTRSPSATPFKGSPLRFTRTPLSTHGAGPEAASTVWKNAESDLILSTADSDADVAGRFPAPAHPEITPIPDVVHGHAGVWLESHFLSAGSYATVSGTTFAYLAQGADVVMVHSGTTRMFTPSLGTVFGAVATTAPSVVPRPHKIMDEEVAEIASSHHTEVHQKDEDSDEPTTSTLTRFVSVQSTIISYTTVTPLGPTAAGIEPIAEAGLFSEDHIELRRR